MSETQQKDYWLPISVLVAAVMIAGAVIYSAGRDDSVSPTASLETAANGEVGVGNAAVLGDPNAPVTLVEFGDYQCPFCARFFSQTESLIKTEYIAAGKVRMAYRNLVILGPESQAAAEAAECAKDQGKFWDYHDALFTAELDEDKNDDGQINGSSENSGNLKKELFMNLASNLGLNAAQFGSCIGSNKYASEIEADIQAAQAVLGPRDGTPTSFVNGQKIVGAQPYAVFKAAIDEALKVR